MIQKLLLRTVLVGGLVLGQLSFLIWLINYLQVNTASPTQQEKSLISSAHADSQLLAYAAPLINPRVPPKTSLSHAHTNVSSLQIKLLDKNRVSLNFPNETFQLNEDERNLLEEHLDSFQIERAHIVRIYAESPSASPEENLLTRPISKLRAQTLARIVYPYTQNVEIIFTSSPSAQAGTLIIEAGLPADYS
ncbi:MAG: hypothetical protein RIT27_196 [Pseudomonadota bacterium]|jgi:hypothetical protein